MQDTEQLANAIYKQENSVKHPYGIMQQKANLSEYRHCCIITIQHIFTRYTLSPLRKKESFIDFLADSYCPIQSDIIGNKNWKHNIKWLLTH